MFSTVVARGYYCCLVVELKQVSQAVWKTQNALKLRRKRATVSHNYEADELFNFISFEYARTEFCNVLVRKKKNPNSRSISSLLLNVSGLASKTTAIFAR